MLMPEMYVRVISRIKKDDEHYYNKYILPLLKQLEPLEKKIQRSHSIVKLTPQELERRKMLINRLTTEINGWLRD
ncbi:MAG: hypothetical protein M0R17_07015 [Candidatus Omnitrophica bacterium]|nr:hypothetical protein [Candidatus Omnitrophota bacterium]